MTPSGPAAGRPRPPSVLGLACALFGCTTLLGPEQVCEEVGFAIAGRTEACTGDDALALARLEVLDADYTCRAEAVMGGVQPEVEPDLYECAYVLRHLACELALEYGDDLDGWLASSPTCGLLLEPR